MAEVRKERVDNGGAQRNKIMPYDMNEGVGTNHVENAGRRNFEFSSDQPINNVFAQPCFISQFCLPPPTVFLLELDKTGEKSLLMIITPLGISRNYSTALPPSTPSFHA